MGGKGFWTNDMDSCDETPRTRRIRAVGLIERKALSRIQKISGANLHRNWVLIPHVTNHEEAEITELEALRVQLNKEHSASGIKVTLLLFSSRRLLRL